MHIFVSGCTDVYKFVQVEFFFLDVTLIYENIEKIFFFAVCV